MAHDAFISHSSQNKAIADAVTAGLENEHIRCWIAPRDVAPGTNYGESIVNAIESCKVVVLIYSAAANVSAPVMREVERAMHFGKPIIPMRLEDVPVAKAMDFYLASCHWLDALTPPVQKHIAQLAAAVRGLISGTGWERSTIPPDQVTAASKWRSWRVAGLIVGVCLAAILAVSLGGTAFMQRLISKSKGAPLSLSFDIDVINIGEEPIAEFFDLSKAAVVRYRSQRSQNSLTIVPTSEYLTNYRSGAPVTALKAPLMPASFFVAQPPSLDLKLLNGTDKTVFLVRAVLHVDESRETEEPILVFADEPRLARTLRIYNEGWTPVANATLRYRLGASGGAFDSGSFKERHLEPFDRSTDVRLEELASDIDFAKDSSASLEAELWYAWRRADGRSEEKVVRCNMEIPLQSITDSVPPKLAATTPNPVPVYRCELKRSGATYVVSTELSQFIKPGEADLFQLQLHSSRSSHHRFVLELFYNDGLEKSLRTSAVDLEYFINRGAVQATAR
jgi:hypothetical protein